MAKVFSELSKGASFYEVNRVGESHADDCYVATQAIICEYELGYRKSADKYISTITKTDKNGSTQGLKTVGNISTTISRNC